MTRVHVAIVLDRSGSMESCRDATISGFNEYVVGIRQTAEQEELETRVTLVTFNQAVETVYLDRSLGRLRRINRKTYVPGGSTAMLDAVGETLERLEKLDRDKDERFLVCIISDGYENASRRYSYADIAQRIGRLVQTERWTFTYLGSNQDLSRVSAELNIPAGNTAAYHATKAGTGNAWRRQREATDRRLRQVSRGERPSEAFYGDDPDPERR